MIKEKINDIIITPTISKDKKLNKVVFITKKSKEEINYKKIFKTNKGEYVSADANPKNEILFKNNNNTENKNLNILEKHSNSNINVSTEIIRTNLENDIPSIVMNKSTNILKEKRKLASYNGVKKKDEEDYNTINNIINRHREMKRNKFIIKKEQLKLPWKKIKSNTNSITNSNSNNNCNIGSRTDPIEKNSPILDYILIEDNHNSDELYLRDNQEFLNKKRRKEKHINNYILLKGQKVNLEEEKEKSKDIIGNEEITENNIRGFKGENRLKEKAIEKIKEKVKKKEENNIKENLEKEEEILKKLINEIISQKIIRNENNNKESTNNNENKNITNNNNREIINKNKEEIKDKKIEKKKIETEQNNLKQSIPSPKEQIKKIDIGTNNTLRLPKMKVDCLDKNKNSESIHSQIINLTSTNDDDIKFDYLNSQNTILLLDDKEKIDNSDISKETSIIKIEENQSECKDALFDLINNNGLETILNCLCKDNLDTENVIENKLNSLRNKYGDLKLIFMLLKSSLDYQSEKYNKYYENYVNKFFVDAFNFEKFLKNEKFLDSLHLFKKKINELIFSDFGLNVDNNQNNNIIPKYFRDKIHSIEKINGNYQKCVSCCENEKKVDYFCKNCKIPLHPECFTIYHNNKVYNNDFRENQKFNLKP